MNHTTTISWLLAIVFTLLGTSSYAKQPPVEDVLNVLGLNEGQIVELTQGRPIIYDLSESNDDEVAAGIAWYLPVPIAKVIEHMRVDNPDLLDLGVIAHGMLTEDSKVDILSPFVLTKENAEELLNAEPGNKFNLSIHEIESIKNLKTALKDAPENVIKSSIEQRYREILFERFQAYRRDGTNAIAPYARRNSLNSRPSSDLRQAALASTILATYVPFMHEAWLNYPKDLPAGTDEAFRWVTKDVENRPAAILRHRINFAWNGGLLVLTREFYSSHSYNSSQWITGCLPFRNGTLAFQQVHSFTDQVSGVASNVKHLIGRKLLKNKMLKSFERLCEGLGQCL